MSSLSDINASVSTPGEKKISVAVMADALKFVIPYIERELSAYEVKEYDGSEADFYVVLMNSDEPLPDNLPPSATVLVGMNTVGTGMTGLPMAIARGIASGRYFHITGNEARLSTVHATDLARAVGLSLGDGGRYFISDGTDPTFTDFAEALAVRLDHKRIFTLKEKYARWLMPASLRKTITTDDVADCTAFTARFDFSPTPVTEYLRTHTYDDSSL